MMFPGLSPELRYLVLSAGLVLVYLSVHALMLHHQAGSRYSAGPRDEEFRPAGLAGRAARAFRNMLETFPVFAALILTVELSNSTDRWTAFGAALYFLARVAYLPAYLAGIPWVRSAIWNVSAIGIVILLWRLAV